MDGEIRVGEDKVRWLSCGVEARDMGCLLVGKLRVEEEEEEGKERN